MNQQQQPSSQSVEVEVTAEGKVQKFVFDGRTYRVKFELERTQIPSWRKDEEVSPPRWMVYMLWTHDGYLVRLSHYIPDDLWFVRELLGFGIDQYRS